ncbi:uncharacterized protein LOC115961495 [Quercus lobata]|uniref:uncharacterized protein LOC115961495 n=1 Tax=Quercus lobata TaxID=97700 RepID=UPI001245F96D|nr:uncharacterized protein LOC115961495 [Quercus lobata]
MAKTGVTEGGSSLMANLWGLIKKAETNGDIRGVSICRNGPRVWRTINNPDSLCHRVFKARFFPDCLIFEAKDSTLGSYAWKSIISARDVIREGMVWRIGNGQSVRIREDKWLPVQSNRSVISSLPSVAPETKVSSLINPELRGWNSSLVNQLFLPYKASVICGMPLSIRLPLDKIIWGLTPSGMFTTKSAYKLLVSCNSTNLAGTSSSENQRLFWRSLWQLRVPNKLKHFSWRACNDALPTMTNLVMRHIATTEVKEDYRVKIFVIIAWMLWNRRNALRLNLQVQPLNRISSLAGSYLQEFLDVQDQTPTATDPSLPQQWQPPDENKFKVNFDAVVFKSCNQARLGVIVRDWRGEAIGPLSMLVPAAQTVVELEAFACRRAVLFAVELGLQDVVFEGDSLQVIQALNLDSTDHLTYGHILEDI